MNKTSIAGCIAAFLGSLVYGGEALVSGGQYADLFLPTPIVGELESDGIWGVGPVKPRDVQNGIEDNIYRYWGGNPIKGKDGKYHLAVARWPRGKHWQKDSEVVYCVSETPTGPYVLKSIIFEVGHNPEVLQLPDGSFILHTMWGVYRTADSMAGPWTLSKKKMKLVNRGLDNDGRIGANLTTELRPDGSIILMKKWGHTAISNNGPAGPYNLVAVDNYDRQTGYPEDPVIWRSRHQYHCVFNHDQDNQSRHMRSLDGINWINEPGRAYNFEMHYTDGSTVTWYQIERPKVVQDEYGRPEYMAFGASDNTDIDGYVHGAKNIVTPMAVEKLISILNKEPITADTKSIRLCIAAEEGFDPIKDLDVNSLRLGSSTVVNYGKGCHAASAKADGQDLIVTFEGDNGLFYHDYDFKMLGKTKSGDLVFGYALLPQKSATAASLIALPPTVKKGALDFTIENYGLDESKPQEILVYEYTKSGRRLVEAVSIAPLKPYEGRPISVALKTQANGPVEYEVVVQGTSRGAEYWRMVNHEDSAVKFSGTWQENPAADAGCFLEGEKVSKTFGDSVKFTFHGTRARAYGRLGRQMGTFDVFIDGKLIERIRSNRNPTIHAKLYQTELLPYAEHTLELRKVEANFNGEVAIDSFSFESPANKEK